jgi:hypothetical protein
MTRLRLKTNNAGDAFAYAERVAAGYGFARPGIPGPQAPMVPMDLGELTADEMMNLFAEFSAWAGYAAVKVAEAEAAEEDVEGDLKVAEARFIINEMEVGGEEKVTVARSRRDSDPEVIRLRKELRRRRAVRKLLTTYFTNYERSAAVLSRELTRRTGLFPSEQRSSK